ncbi:glycosyltransferase [bacterium D16-54]|nr:glycosyltransferase [bacterium D16-54]RKJ15657.1 glycosyltransferase [bacterium D16-56]
MPEVSVIMSTYNEKLQYLTEAIESVLNQTFKNYEFIIILDNPQNDAIRDCVYQYAEKDFRIKVIENDSNIGLTKSLNKAIQNANGKYMSRMDADDIMHKNCLECELAVIKKYHLDFVSASKINIDEHGKRLGIYINNISPKQMKKLLPYDNSINHSTTMVRMDLIRKENGYREIPSCEDYDLWLRLLFHGCRMRLLPNVFLLYRMRADGVCGQNAYQLYLSKRFLLKMCKICKKNPSIWNSKRAFMNFIEEQDMSENKKNKFNRAFELMYKSFTYLKNKEYKDGTICILQAIYLDKDILWIILNKFRYQIRKKLVPYFVCF